ncbi:MAG: Alpha-2-macroglobulin family protein [Bacteroidetes bacterium ADurb.Bin408]|nr:MAG: Alpha-2-macroglobulin family protein [Bacteroidetes bacterium ADurb.Bin408]
MVMSEVTTRESGGHGRFKACKRKADSNMAYGAGRATAGDVTVVKDAMEAPPPPAEPVTATGELRGAKNGKDLPEIQTRSNFAETAFFFPQLQTDDEGNLIIKFTIPETLTKWKFMGFAHTKDLKFGQIKKDIVTQKELMVVTNAPRFLREGDKITFSAKVSNISDKDLSGQAQLKLFDALTMKPVDSLLKNTNTLLSFEVKKGQSASLSWDIEIPDGLQAITYKVVAKAGAFSDGEEMALPVLSNRMLVTETMPLPIRGKQTKEYNFTKLINAQSSSTLRSHKLTLEFTSNPAWYAIQALPYLMEYPYECSEQVFSRFYANSIASHIANSSPKIKAVFDSWKNITPDALLSNLEKNQELKGLILEETPWVLDAKDESQRKKRVGLLFDLNKMANELDAALNKLIKAQSPNGGFPWFKGMPDCRYITQHIVTGFGHLDHLGVKNVRNHGRTWNMVNSAVKYLDNRIDEDYEYIKKWHADDMDKNHLGYEQIQYLYARSYFKDVNMAARNKEAFDYFKGQAKKYWLDFNRYSQGMIALALHRYEDQVTAMNIIKSLKDNALTSDEMGMYWKDMSGGWYWYQAPIETQALLIEAFDEVAGDKVSVEDMKVWLLKQKQTQDWKTTKATVEACYALLLRGADVLASDQLVEINIGNITIDPKKLDGVKVEAGTGYFKTSWSGGDIKPEMGHVKVIKKDEGVAWGAVYWQYFEQLDKITPAETPLKLEKKLFVQRNTPTGPVIEPITEQTALKVGDKIKVRIELRVDRDMEFVHMKDMRASGFEPVNVISQYKYQDGLGYYENTRDAATNFFFNNLNKGTYVFEYPLFVTHKGDFSNGITTIQCMYAPEFTAHSEGVRVKVE